MRRIFRKSPHPAWDTLVPFPHLAALELWGFQRLLTANVWMQPPHLPPSLLACNSVLAMDSSGYAGAYLRATSVLHTEYTATWWQWPLRARAHNSTPVLEALAILRALQDSPDLQPPILILCDCLPVLQAWAKGYSPRPTLNRIIQVLIQMAPKSLRIHVKTDLQPADPYSRRHDEGFSRQTGSFISAALAGALQNSLPVN